MKLHTLSWQDLGEKDEHLMTYLLYKEGKDVELIAKIRRLSVEEVNHHLIRAKWERLSADRKEKTLLERMIEMDKRERKDILKAMTTNEKTVLAREIYKKYFEINHSEDKMLVIWLIGELKLRELLGCIHEDIHHPHGNVRRLACSAIGKIGDVSSLNYLHKALVDTKPQVRQYAAKALGNLGDRKTVQKIRHLLYNPNERDYVRRAFEEAIKKIEMRYSID
ncbi:Helix-turn-helix domain-containing protein [Geosporobacter subterraneus DSM 17957]|uniref:Helix-turn-helix domain-containing protein n=1 Tax=Geosporobacter subterraneus DSM 17957 TaxID=1121919 RepID=A0A1M6I792_9FIRM|nr:HEAT repeat domain-containing protein [Geosporobacter subterraneus]SHJ30253.1 Helix-turn-helix domain-containing protein [Geosporobacter subterraneus DSM 17957]